MTTLKRLRTTYEQSPYASLHNKRPSEQLKLQMPNIRKINGITQYHFTSKGQSITTEDAPYIPVFFKNSNNELVPVIDGIDNAADTHHSRFAESYTTQPNKYRPLYDGDGKELPINIFSTDISRYIPKSRASWGERLYVLPLNKHEQIIYNSNLSGELFGETPDIDESELNRHDIEQITRLKEQRELFETAYENCDHVMDPTGKQYNFAGCYQSGGKKTKRSRKTKKSRKTKRSKKTKRSRKRCLFR